MSVKNTLFKEGKRLSLDQVMGILKNHKDVLLGSDWLGLSEVTNHNGEYCQFSCDSQAWSSAVLIEAIFAHSSQFEDSDLEDGTDHES
jgi:hypothetical protein